MKQYVEIIDVFAREILDSRGNPTVEDRVLAAKMACRAVELIECGQSGRVIGIKGGEIFDTTVLEALACKKGFDEKLYEIAQIISR